MMASLDLCVVPEADADQRTKPLTLLGVNGTTWCHPHVLRLVKKLRRSRRFWTDPSGPSADDHADIAKARAHMIRQAVSEYLM